MQAYRIGEVKLPWVNFVPPLHGGIYRKYGSDNPDLDVLESDMSDQSSETAVYCSSSTSVTGDSSDQEPSKQLVARKPAMAIQKAGALSADSSSPAPVDKETLSSPPWTHLSRAAYTALLEQKEVHQATTAYPSLDLGTQQNISREYRALHERIKDEGFYKCRYSEYGKDAVRWVFLFSLFVLCFSAKWYLTSAVFLGMFWVLHRSVC
jgi:delta8-fatty-acid desaturase